MSLSLDIRHRLGGFALDVRFESEGRLTALFGRSGAGKTSLVNIIAGLIRPDEGRVTVDGEALVDTAAGIFVPKHRRRVGYVFQEGRLFPHLSVRANLLYGRWFTPAAQRYETLDQAVELLGLGPLLDRRPGSLSGGEKQRVAIGRALLASPRLLLLDEPLASLDEARRQEILPYIERLRDVTKIPIVYVSHSVAEVTRLATTVVVLSHGKAAAVGGTAEIMGRLDLFPFTGRGEAGAVIEAQVAAHDAASGLTMLECPAGILRMPHTDLAPGSAVRVRIRARDVLLAVKKPEGLSALNVLGGVVREIGAESGPIAEIRLDCGGQTLLARITRHSVAALGLAPGTPAYAVIKAIALDRRSLGGPLQEFDAADLDADVG
ncbi:MAG: molybdenum ABC transporter ATP-binding protein [Alphaproteobacteria bacterium]|nr:molybdenum ABC transporter ATP-binding protein [Alphaproteobacteria bacterium]